MNCQHKIKPTKLFLLFFIALIFSPLISKSQDPTFSISGKVFETTTKEALFGVKVLLIESNGDVLKIVTDNTGKYYFDKTQVKPGTEYLLVCTYHGWPVISHNISTFGLTESKSFTFNFDFRFQGLIHVPK